MFNIYLIKHDNKWNAQTLQTKSTHTYQRISRAFNMTRSIQIYIVETNLQSTLLHCLMTGNPFTLNKRKVARIDFVQMTKNQKTRTN